MERAPVGGEQVRCAGADEVEGMRERHVPDPTRPPCAHRGFGGAQGVDRRLSWQSERRWPGSRLPPSVPCRQGAVSIWSPSNMQGSVLGFAQSLNAMARILGSAVGIPLLKYSTTLPYSSAAVLMIITAIFIAMASRFQGRGE